MRLSVGLFVCALSLAAQTSTVTYTTKGGTCGPQTCYNVVFYNPDGTLLSNSGYITYAPKWQDGVHWTSQCFTGTVITAATFPTVSASDPGPKYGTLSGSCNGVDASGHSYSMQFHIQTMTRYNLSGGGRGNPAVKRSLLNGTATVFE